MEYKRCRSCGSALNQLGYCNSCTNDCGTTSKTETTYKRCRQCNSALNQLGYCNSCGDGWS